MDERATWRSRVLTLCLTLVFATPILAPLASADGMSSCDGAGFSDCDDYDSNDDELRSSKIGFEEPMILICKIHQQFK